MSSAPLAFITVGQLKYYPEEPLGKGGFGNVFKGEFEDQAVAVKQNLLRQSSIVEAELGLVSFGIDKWHQHLARYLHKEKDTHFL